MVVKIKRIAQYANFGGVQYAILRLCASSQYFQKHSIIETAVTSSQYFRKHSKLLKKPKVGNRKLSKDRKTHLNVIAIFNMYTLITKTKNFKFYAEGLAAKL